MMRRTSVCCLLAALAGCKSSPTTSGSGTLDHVSITPSSTTVLQGGTTQLTAHALTASGGEITPASFTWSVDSASIATVSATGVVAGVAPGTVTVTATSSGKSGTATVEVVLVPATRIDVAPAASTIEIGAVEDLVATVYDGLGHQLGRPVTWTSSNPGVADVTDSGEVIGFAEGSAVITATREGVFGTATVAVVKPAVAALTISPDSAVLVPPQTQQLDVSLTDARGNPITGRTITYSTRDPFVADVSPAGVVTAVGTGRTYVVVACESQSDSMLVVVTPPPPAGLETEINNHLIYPIQVSVNGSARGLAPPGGTLALISDSIPLLQVSWTILAPQSGGQPVGEILHDTLPPVVNAGGIVTFDVTSQTTSGIQYFTPVLTNATPSTLQLDIPVRFSAQPCQCFLVSDSAQHDQFGYWRLTPDATVNAYGRNDPGHTGPHVDAAVLPAAVDPLSGVWRYTFTVAP